MMDLESTLIITPTHSPFEPCATEGLRSPKDVRDLLQLGMYGAQASTIGPPFTLNGGNDKTTEQSLSAPQ